MKSIAFVLCGVAVTALASSAGGGAPKVPKTKLNREQRAAHLLNRIGYGPKPGQIEAVLAFGEAAYIERQLHPQAIDDSALEKRLASLESIHMSSRELASLFPRPGLVQRLVREGVIDRSQVRGRPMPPAASGEGEPEPAMAADEMRRRPRGFRGGFNPLEYTISRLPEPIQPPGRRGGFEPPIQGLNPMPVLVAQLQAAKLLRAVESERQLLEVMTDFWFNHFNVFIGKPQARVLVTEYEREVIRPNALGKFRDLLGAVAHSPAMLAYLDNAQSVAPDSPAGRRQGRGLNENYARELLELHTLGVDGGYTQQDVTEAARILTGWTPAAGRFARGGGSSTFLALAHDPGEKTVLGTRFEPGGEQEGEKLLDLLARHPATARFLATKLARRFVADDPPSALVSEVAGVYEKTGGDIREMLRAILYSKEFWSEDSFRAKAKRPFELVASTIRALDADLEPTPQLLGLLERMGEPLYMCQPPTGYDDTAGAWLGSDQLVTRWNFALETVIGNVPGVRASAEALEAEGPDEQRLRAYAERFLHQKLSDEERGRLLAAVVEIPDEALASVVLGSPEFQRR